MTDHLSYRLLLILSLSRQLLGVPHGEGVSLARISVPRWTRQAEQLTQAIATMWQLRVVVLDFLPPNDSGEFCAVVEVRSDDSAEAMGQFAFADPANLPSTELNDAERDVLDSIISQKRSPRGPFSRIGWIDAVAELDFAAVFLHNSAADPKAKPGAQFSLGGKEGFKELGLNTLGNPGSAVADGHHRAGAGICG